jgi:hypothetical protein
MISSTELRQIGDFRLRKRRTSNAKIPRLLPEPARACWDHHTHGLGDMYARVSQSPEVLKWWFWPKKVENALSFNGS